MGPGGQSDTDASSLREDRATHERSQSSLSPPAVGVPLRGLAIADGRRMAETVQQGSVRSTTSGGVQRAIARPEAA